MAGQTDYTDDRTIKPLYLKDSDIQCKDNGRVTDFDLMESVTKIIGNSLHCLQQDRNLWRFYLKDRSSREKLLSNGLELNNVSISFFDTNPYSSGNHNPNETTLKIRICGLPLSVDDSAVSELLDKLGCVAKSKILYEKIRHPVSNKMTSVLNGNRFLYIEPLPIGKSLPRVNSCGGLRCLIFHYGQPKVVKHLLCTNCWATDHTRKNCKSESKCKVCKKSGHTPGDRKCDSYEVQQNIIAFNGEDNILSNFFQCEMTLYGVTHKSAEHAFQYAKAMRCGDQNAAAQIQSATDALSAKRIGDKVKTNEQWNNTCEKVMTEVVENKCVQVERFREKLRSSNKHAIFVESTYNDTWGSGLDRVGTENTKQAAWPGKNLLGKIIAKVAKKSRKRKKSEQWSRPKQTQQPKESSKQRDIVKMLKDMRAQSDSDSFSGWDSSDSESESDAQSLHG